MFSYRRYRIKLDAKKRFEPVGIFLLVLLFIISVITLLIYQFKSFKDNDELKELKKDIGFNEENEEQYVTIDGVKVQKKFEKLYRDNKDFVGWLQVEGTSIDYPVLQNNDDTYYLHKGFDQEYSAGGSIFMDSRCDILYPSDNFLLYGHHMINRTMFGSLDSYENEDYYKSHKYVHFDTIDSDGLYEVIAAFRTKLYTEDTNNFQFNKFIYASTPTEFDEFIYNCKNLTPFKIDTTATFGDQLLTLSTCAYHTHNGRFVVVAKKINIKGELEK